ncbi:MAG: undecaprenyl/decaprenyl-phosphate alpha-N-acetylglucosaminyl 1-phosphate transferase [Polyangiaceae bacterium]|nr:undecaprenyl/decaprenyl-phosphate alpha-N-acetylglucosaminyl 1-phosphate transferase [Polyangiaceae bacterium]
MLSVCLVAALVALLVAAALVPPVRVLARALGAVDAPGGRRVHARVTPRMGGLAVATGYGAALAVVIAASMFPWGKTGIKPAGLALFGAGALLIVVVGALDDARDLGAKKKLVAQIAAASVAFSGGAKIETLDVPLLGQFHFSPVVSWALTVMWIVSFINAINLIDGLDGLASGVVFFAALTNTAIAVLTGNALAAVLNVSLACAVLGFLFYNFNPATIFLGDTGSMFLGYVLGASALMSGRQKESTIASLLVPIIALGLPISDTLFAMIRRFVARRPIFSADRGHIHHRLLDLGLTHRRAVLTLYGCTVLLCVAAMGAAFGKNWQVGAALVAALLTLVGIAKFAGYFEIAVLRKQQRALLLSPSTEALRKALPELIVEAGRASSEAGVWTSFERLLDAGWFAYAEYVPSGEGAPTWRWDASERNPPREGKLHEAEFQVRLFPGQQPGAVKVGCLSDQAELPPQVEVLLQVGVDAVERAITRVHVGAPTSMLRAVP